METKVEERMAASRTEQDGFICGEKKWKCEVSKILPEGNFSLARLDINAASDTAMPEI